MNPLQPISNPFLAVVLRAALGSYVIYMARSFYADPMGYFRKWARGMPEYSWVNQVVRGLACFCLWGGCFIVATVVAVQILGLHGDRLAVALVVLAAIAAWLLLPKRAARGGEDLSNADNLRRPK